MNTPRPTAKATSATILCALPLASYIAVLAFAIIAFLQVGHWPSYGNPDPGTLRLPVFYWLALLAYPLAFLSTVFGAVAVPMTWPTLQRRDIGLFFTGVALWLVTFPLVSQLWNWLGD